MKLNFEAIKAMTSGAASVTESESGISFSRFPEEQSLYYKNERGPESYVRSISSSGIRISFRTDSRSLRITGSVVAASSRKYYSIDVKRDGELIGCIDNIGRAELEGDYAGTDLPLCDFSGELDLGEGMKEIVIYLPWSVGVTVTSLELDDGAVAEPVRRSRTLLAYGDSITQGYDARRPSNCYVARLTDLLGAEEHNRGIGGEIFAPRLAELSDDLHPDFVTVAYGTNDWSREGECGFRDRARAFYLTLSRRYPDALIFAIGPIWRADCDEERGFGPFTLIGRYISEVVADLPNVRYISGDRLVPHDTGLYGDLRLHPSDEGFACYADRLYAEIQKHLSDR